MTEVIKEYAEALFILALEENKEDEYMKAIEDALSAFESEPDYIEFLSAPGIPLMERVGAVEAVFGGKLPSNVVSFMQLLCEKGRIASFKSCVNEYRNLLLAKKNITSAFVTSAVELTEAEKTALKRKLEKISGNSVELHLSVDESLLGGLMVEMNGTVMDGTLRQRLREVKEVMNQ